MQMRKSYLTTNRRRRAEQLRQDAQECANAGFMDFARVNGETAAFIDPPRFEDDPELLNQR